MVFSTTLRGLFEGNGAARRLVPEPPDESDLDPVAFEAACRSVLWSWSVHFRPEIAQVIRTYERVKGETS